MVDQSVGVNPKVRGDEKGQLVVVKDSAESTVYVHCSLLRWVLSQSIADNSEDFIG